MTRLLVLAVGVLGGPLPFVLAQTASGTSQPRSLWEVFFRGIEWPAYFILAGSFAIIAIIVDHFITIRRINIAPQDQVAKARQLIELRKFRECLELVNRSTTFFARALTAALTHGRHGFDAMHEAAIEKSSEMSGRMFRRVEFMNIIGNLGPLLGLLGTVWGMIIAFKDLGSGGGAANAGELARGISLALVNTLLGLILAVVGLGFFGWCRNRVDSMTVQATVEVLDLLEYFRPVPTATEVRPVAASPAPHARSAGAEPAAATAPPRAASAATGRAGS